MIVPEAKCLWFTPKNRKELLKQIKNYSIADMQIYGLSKIIEREKRNITKLIIDIVCMIGAVFSAFTNLKFVTIFMSIFLILHAVDAYKYRGKNYKMVVEMRYYKLYYYFRFRKYFNKEFSVNRGEKK